MVVWPSVKRRTQTQNGWHDWFLDSRSSRYYGLNISAIETPMAKPTCRDVYNDKTHILHEGFDDLTNVWWGTTLSNRGAMLLKQQGQQTPKRWWYLFHLEFYCHGISQGCVQRYKTLCGWRTWLLEWWIIGNTHANRQELCCRTAGTSCTRTIITLSYWAPWPWNIAEMCSRI